MANNNKLRKLISTVHNKHAKKRSEAQAKRMKRRIVKKSKRIS